LLPFSLHGAPTQPQKIPSPLTPDEQASITTYDPLRNIPYKAGLKLTYSVGWGWIPVGTAVLSVQEEFLENNLPSLRFTMSVQTNSFADTFYEVRNEASSWTDPSLGKTLQYQSIQHEGKRHREYRIDFDLENQTATRVDLLEGTSREPVSIHPGTLDPVSLTFLLGTLPLSPTDQITIPTTNGKELFLTNVKIVETVKRRFKFSKDKQNALLLDPDIKDLGGVFKKKEDSKVTIWLATSFPHIPYRIESEVAVGSFWVELVQIEGLE